MLARRAIQRVNDSASMVLVKPFIVLAARVLGPGPTRLRLVKLAHNLDHNGLAAGFEERGQAESQAPSVQQPTRRAA